MYVFADDLLLFGYIQPHYTKGYLQNTIQWRPQVKKTKP